MKITPSISIFALLFAASFSCQAAQPFTVGTAPDNASKLILSKAISKIDQGSVGTSDHAPAIHRNFPQVIEQNFARLNSTNTRQLIDNLSDKEIHYLAQLYMKACSDSGHAKLLLDVLAVRLDTKRLTRVATFFGVEPIANALSAVNPLKAQKFAQTKSLEIQTAGSTGATTDAGVGGQWLNSAPSEIYMDMRTAPIGALGVAGALYETANVLGINLGIAYEAGQTAGTAAVGLIQTYDLPLWDTISGTVGQMVENLLSAPTVVQQGQIEQSMATEYELTMSTNEEIYDSGGDYDNASA
jgi:hypothetical protein